MKLLIDYALYYAEFKKNAQVSIYSLADLNIGYCSLRASWVVFCGKGPKI